MRLRALFRRRPQADYVDQLRRWRDMPPDNETHTVRPLALPAIQPLKARRDVTSVERFRIGRK
jgi:hypothetical protein